MAEQAANNEFHSIQVHQFCSMLLTIQGGSGCYNSCTGRLVDLWQGIVYWLSSKSMPLVTQYTRICNCLRHSLMVVTPILQKLSINQKYASMTWNLQLNINLKREALSPTVSIKANLENKKSSSLLDIDSQRK